MWHNKCSHRTLWKWSNSGFDWAFCIVVSGQLESINSRIRGQVCTRPRYSTMFSLSFPLARVSRILLHANYIVCATNDSRLAARCNKRKRLHTHTYSPNNTANTSELFSDRRIGNIGGLICAAFAPSNRAVHMEAILANSIQSTHRFFHPNILRGITRRALFGCCSCRTYGNGRVENVLYRCRLAKCFSIYIIFRYD